MSRISGAFADEIHAVRARDRLVATGVPGANISITGIDQSQPAASAGEARFMGRIVLIIVFWSVIGTGIGAALGAGIAEVFGPAGTSGLIIQVVTWAIFAHLLVGMWAGYVLLADRSGREMARPVRLTMRCGSIDETRLREQLEKLGATNIESPNEAPARQR